MDISTSHFSAAASHDIIERLFKAPVERHILDNGLTLVHRPDFSSEVVSVQVWVKTGSIHEDALIGSGLSHYLEHLLFKGTERRDGKSIGREVHGMGGGQRERTRRLVEDLSSKSLPSVPIWVVVSHQASLPEAETHPEVRPPKCLYRISKV